MTYKNDFGFNAESDELTTPAWNEQPIELPLSTWTNSLLRIAELENELRRAPHVGGRERQGAPARERERAAEGRPRRDAERGGGGGIAWACAF